MKKKALLILADGFEDVEAVTAIDILRRAEVDVTVAGLREGLICGARGTSVQPDTVLERAKDDVYDALVLPGGTKGAENLAASETVRQTIFRMYREGKIVAAICAAPAVVLAPLGILNGKRATCFPGLEERFPKDTARSADPVVVDGTIITSRALGTALPFSLVLTEKLCGSQVAENIRKAVLA